MNEPLTFGSVFSGIEAASVAWHRLGWRCAWLAEVEPFPCAVLSERLGASAPERLPEGKDPKQYARPAAPMLRNLGDMTTVAARVLAGEVEAPDILCGGSPCQSFSLAGLRQSMSDPRGNLALSFVQLADAIDAVRDAAGKPPAIIFWENVPGVFTTADNAFGCFLAGLAGAPDPLVPGPRPERGRSSAHWRWSEKAGGHVPRWPDAGGAYGPARAVGWRCLDAQYAGLAQRRERVFAVASAGARFDPLEVLLEWESVRRDSPPSRGPGQETA